MRIEVEVVESKRFYLRLSQSYRSSTTKMTSAPFLPL